jgi:hypothetical protein
MERFNVNRKVLMSYWIMGLILLPAVFTQALASQMEVFMLPSTDTAKPDFTGIEFLTIKYPPGSELSKIFNGTTETLSFTLNSTHPGMDKLVKTVNDAILVEKNSPVQLENATVEYIAQIRGDENRVSIAYKLKFDPVMTKFVLPSNGTTAVDLDWRSFQVNEPLTINVPQYDNFDINYPIAPIQALFPDGAELLLSSEDTKKILEAPLMNFEEIGLPMNRWHFLFDPTGSQATAAGSGYTEEGGSRVVSVFSLGESSFREGTHTVTESSVATNVGGSDISMRASTPPPSGQIQLAGFAKVQNVGGAEIAFISPNAPEGTVTSSGNFPIQVLLIFGGMMGAVAVLVLLKARKK